MNKPMRFLFVGFRRPWNPLKGFEGEARTPEVCELRSLPGNLVSWGGTKEEAVENLRRTVVAAMKKAPDPDVWYDAILNGMTQGDRDDANAFWARVFAERCDLRHFEDGEDFLGLKGRMEYATFVTADSTAEDTACAR